ncbi:hypothetical protein HDU96_000114 [Phlyctochytrium bullatum]|nr:hypothetical protein HDU96_000114 [Phlyctochytrium bullatum]
MAVAAKALPRFVIRKSGERGVGKHGWLESWHTFSFESYYDKRFNGHGPLRVINEDFVKPVNGFGTHPHTNFQIFSYIVRGALEHRDSLGNVETLPRGFIQFTNAGTGLMHSEMNVSQTDPVHFIQLWARPHTKGLNPSYATLHVSDADKLDPPHLRPLIIPHALHTELAASGSKFRGIDAAAGLIGIHQDFYFFAALLNSGKFTRHTPVGDGRLGYVHMVMSGTESALEVSTGENDAVKVRLEEGDGLYVHDMSKDNELIFTSVGGGQAEFLFMDMVKTETKY